MVERLRRIPAAVWAWSVCGVLLVVGVLAEFVLPGPITGPPPLIAACFVAAALLSPAATMLVGGTVLLIEAVVLLVFGLDFHDAQDLVALVALVVVSAVVCRVRTRRRAELATVREVAEAAQRAVLPPPDGRYGRLLVASRYDAAGSAAHIGGDLLAVESTQHGVRMLIADVRGKGLGAISVVGGVAGAFAEYAHLASDLPTLVSLLEASLRRRKARSRPTGGVGYDVPDSAELFVTALVAEVARDGRTLRTASCGHPAPLVVRGADGAVEVLEPAEDGLPLGLRDLAPGPAVVRSDELREGDALLLFTDGLAEARDAAGAFFDPVAWVAARGAGVSDPGAVLRELGDAVVRHTGGVLQDDTSMLVVRRDA
ncbi:PP2C family protein-serine/threonine phosphatase [Mangrovactinospora gilvigrisea]|uniref:PP2C family protein-serine/threonine phosphatase n=1 Tax=Mangrovactinospora gilvigrisea TaxID=1428644 RepID=UPI0015872F4B|nr:PP2C family protein-serine/threonine phosphatase [Mangrovactinospora gilvigrisea]